MFMNIKQPKSITIATRKSPLALWQANYVRDQLQQCYPDIVFKLYPVITEADRRSEEPITSFGGKGVFVKALEQALYDGKADIAVHSMKDVPTELPDGLIIAAVCARADSRDVLVFNRKLKNKSIEELGSIGTSSLRRIMQLKYLYSGWSFVALRGNIATRIERMQAQNLDAIVLASVGLHRLGMSAHISRTFSVDEVLPAAGQGVIGIECRADDKVIKQVVAKISHADTMLCVQAERALTNALGGDCYAPVAAHAFFSNQGKNITLHARVGGIVDTKLIHAESSIIIADNKLELMVSDVLLQLNKQGAQSLIESAKGGNK